MEREKKKQTKMSFRGVKCATQALIEMKLKALSCRQTEERDNSV